jgi:hypothetical protein
MKKNKEDKKSILVHARIQVMKALSSFVREKRRKTRKIVWFKISTLDNILHVILDFRHTKSREVKKVSLDFRPLKKERLTPQSIVKCASYSERISFSFYEHINSEDIQRVILEYLKSLEKGKEAEDLFKNDAESLGWKVEKTKNNQDIRGEDFIVSLGEYAFTIDIKSSKDGLTYFKSKFPEKPALVYGDGCKEKLHKALTLIGKSVLSKDGINIHLNIRDL